LSTLLPKPEVEELPLEEEEEEEEL